MLPAKIEKRISPEPNSGCWLWVGTISVHGYGRMKRNGKPVPAHRLVYELLRGPIPDGLVLDHKCRLKCCVNPDHLEPVTIGENSRRGIKGRLTTHCPQGHAYDEANTYRWPPGTERRYCRACARDLQRRKRERLRRAA